MGLQKARRIFHGGLSFFAGLGARRVALGCWREGSTLLVKVWADFKRIVIVSLKTVVFWYILYILYRIHVCRFAVGLLKKEIFAYLLIFATQFQNKRATSLGLHSFLICFIFYFHINRLSKLASLRPPSWLTRRDSENSNFFFCTGGKPIFTHPKVVPGRTSAGFRC